MRRLMLVAALFTIAGLIIGCAAPVEKPSSSGKPQEEEILMQDQGQLSALMAANDDRFTARAAADGTMTLNWQPIEGAEKYLLEILTDDESLLPLAWLAGDALSYVDENLPPDTLFTYQLSSVSASERQETRLVVVQTPPASPDPLTVTLEFDQTQPVMDFSTIDPENIDPEALADLFASMEVGDDGQGFDVSAFIPTPVSASALIGPDGGELSVTSSTGFVYTLSIPQGALLFEVPVTLKPVAAIPDLPLSGGMDAAIVIEPEGIPLEIPAMLTIQAPEGYVLTSGEAQVGFAFGAGGEEFHLYPLVEDGAQARSGYHFAKVTSKPMQAGPLAQIAQQQLDQFAGYGKGSGTKEDIKKVNNRVSSKTKNRAAASAATAQQKAKFVQPVEDAFDEELAPLLPPEALNLAKYGQSILQKATNASDWNKFMDALDDFSVYYQNNGDKYNQALNNRILDALVSRSYELLQKNKGQCLSSDDLKAQTLVERLVKAQNKTYQAISARFKEKYGSKLLEDLYNGIKPCTYELEFKSSLSYDAEGSVWFTSTEVAPFRLYPVFAAGELFFWGSGMMLQSQTISGTCSAPVSQYDNLRFVAQKLEPEFNDNGLLVDFALTRYFVSGMQQLQDVDVSGDDCLRSINFQGGGDFWSAFFTMSRATNGQFNLRNWTIEGDIVNGSSVTATWESVRDSFSPMGESGKMSEDSKFKLQIKKNK